MRSKLPATVKEHVTTQANGRCKYSLLPERESFCNFHVDRLKSIKHGGTFTQENLTYCSRTATSSKAPTMGRFRGLKKCTWSASSTPEKTIGTTTSNCTRA